MATIYTITRYLTQDYASIDKQPPYAK